MIRASVITMFLVLVVLFLPVTASAQVFVTCDGADCQWCNLVDMGNAIVKFILLVFFVLAGILIAVAGIKLVTSGGNVSAKESAKSLLINAIIGLIIVLAAWLLIDTIIRQLIGDSGQINGRFWAQIECNWNQTQALKFESATDVVDTTGTTASGPTPTGDASVAGDTLTDAEARAIVDAAGIEYKDSVSFEGVRPHVLDELQTLDATCNCDILITSITDGNMHTAGTFSHYEGFKADLRTRDNPQLVSYVQSLQPAGSWSDGTPLYFDSASCGTYAIEDNHIDVVYKTGC